MTDEPAARAHALLEHLFQILHEFRALVPQLERGPEGETPSAEAERLPYYALTGAIEAGLVRTAENALTVLRQASAPLGPMGAEWLNRPGARAIARQCEELDGVGPGAAVAFSASREATLA